MPPELTRELIDISHLPNRKILVYIYCIGGAREGGWRSLPQDISEVSSSQVASDFGCCPLSLLALEATDPVCIRKSLYSACKEVTCTICECLYASERCCVFGLG